jgi:phospholipid transport system substrate-binding protein
MLKSRARVASTVVLLLMLAPAHAAWAGAPTDQLRDGVDRVFKILRDPAMAGDANAPQRRKAVLTAAGTIFDFNEMAKRSLAQHWAERTPAERTQFTALFTDLLQHSYISKVDQHGSAKMVFGDEKIEGDHATVRTVIPLSNGSQMPLEYRMHQANGRWQVYDIGMDGISLLANYRAQFNKVIRIDSYAALVTKLQSHQSEFSQPDTARPSAKRAR